MKSKTKLVKRKNKPAPKKVARKSPPTRAQAQPRKGLSQVKRDILTRVWPKISDKTKIVELPESASTISYPLPSGESTTANLMWYSFSHGPRVYGLYDDANDVVYVGKIVQ